MRRYRRRKTTGSEEPLTRRDKALRVAEDGSPLAEIIRDKLQLEDRAKKAIGSISSHCTYCKTELGKKEGKEGHKIYNRNQGARPIIHLCNSCFNDRAKKQKYLGVV
jgi:hypothetical protein